MTTARLADATQNIAGSQRADQFQFASDSNGSLNDQSSFQDVANNKSQSEGAQSN